MGRLLQRAPRGRCAGGYDRADRPLDPGLTARPGVGFGGRTFEHLPRCMVGADMDGCGGQHAGDGAGSGVAGRVTDPMGEWLAAAGRVPLLTVVS